MKRHALAGLMATTALIPHTAPAQDFTDLGTIILSGGLTPVAAERYGRSASVLTAEEIGERGLASVQEALRALPGVAVSGAGGDYTQVRIRGAESGHALILIDGVEAAAGDGEYILSGLDTANIERIEVLRGPQSVYYGSNASAGVINIITRDGMAGGREFSARLEAGSHGSTNASLFASARGERGGLSFSVSDVRDAGWDYSGSGGERDETNRRSFVLKGDYRITDSVKLGFNLRHADEESDADGNSFAATDAASYVVDDPTQFSTREELTASVFAEHEALGGRLVHRLSLELTESDRTFNAAPVENARTEAYKYRLSYGLDGVVREADHLLNFLLEREEDSSSTNPLYRRETNSVALEYRGSFASGFDLQAGMRFDDNSVFGDSTTWNLGAAYTFAESGVRLHASAGTGVVNPTYFELYANAWGYTGNPALNPERNESFDIGVEVPFAGGRGSIDVTYFNERLQDEITDVSTGPGTFTYVNQAGTSTREGVEIEGRYAASDLVDLRLFYTYLDARNPDGSRETRRPMHELGFGVTARTRDGRGSVTADLRHVAGNVDSQFFPPFGLAELPDYTVVNLSARYAVTERLDATLRVENLLDESYSDVWGYAGRDRTVFVGLNANW